MGMVLYGMDNTRTITDLMMINHAKAVKKAAKKSLVFFDLPFQKKFDEKKVITRVKNILKKTGCDGVKIEGNAELINVIQKLKKLNIPVMAHLGLQPQKFTSSKNFKIYGKNKKDLDKIIEDSIKLQNSGAVALLLEGMKTNIAKKITEIAEIPTIGIGASEFCDGQILVSEDMLGIFTEYHPKFVKKYVNLSDKIKNAVKKYVSEIDRVKFPNKNFRYD